MLLYVFLFTGLSEAWEGKNVYVLLSKLGQFKNFLWRHLENLLPLYKLKVRLVLTVSWVWL